MDQRGAPRSVAQAAPNAWGGDGAGIGAFEVVPFPRLRAQLADNAMTLIFDTSVGKTVGAGVPGTGGPATFTYPIGAAVRLYRVRLVP